MNVKLEFYRVFAEVAKQGTFSKAAEALYLTQPAVSQSVMQLEQQLDVQLFYRTSKGAVLTQAGELLASYVDPALQSIKQGERRLEEMKDITFGELVIGVGDTIATHVLMDNLHDFHTLYPHIKFTLQNGTTPQLLEWLKSDRVDIAICNLPLEDAQVTVEPLFKVNDIFVYGDKYARLLGGETSYEQLVKLPLVLLEEKSNSRRYLNHYFSQYGIVLQPEFELGSHDLLLEFAKNNFGIAAVTRQFSLAALQEGKVREVHLTQPIPARQVGVCYKTTRALSAAAQRFMQLLVEEHRL